MAQYQERRSRTVIWHDPMPSLRAAQTMSGIDVAGVVVESSDPNMKEGDEVIAMS